jgi:hypothetical protein
MSRAGTAVLAALAVCMTGAPVAGASSPGVSGHSVEQSPGAIRDYWTPERMREAQPLDAPQAGTEPVTPLASSSSQPPDRETDPALDQTYPQRIHGRLFLTFAPDNATCSATVVRSFTRNLILTAGHCLVQATSAGPRWATNVAFVPSYRNNVRPFGTWPATKLRTPAIFAGEGLIDFDIGAVNLAASPFGNIQDLLGARGVIFNRTPGSYRGQRFKIFGYPADPIAFYDGERLIVCDSPFRGFEGFSGAITSGPCHMQQGSSGGGWVIKGGLVNSVVSHGSCGVDSDACQVMSGTYFGGAAFNVWAKAAGGLPKGRRKRIRACKRKGGRKTRSCLIRAQTFKPVTRGLVQP